MFDRVAARYDFVNDVMTMGQHRTWRRFAARATRPTGARVLDLATGTGDLAIQFAHAGARRIIALDFSEAMLVAAQAKFRSTRMPTPVDLVQGDVLHLPFPDQSFDRVSSAFLLRNLTSLGAGLAEMYRVLSPGGWLIALEVTHPDSSVMSRLAGWWFQRVVPIVGGALSGQWSAYEYLPASLGPLPPARNLSEMMIHVGFRNVHFERLGLGSVAVHVGQVQGSAENVDDEWRPRTIPGSAPTPTA